MAELGCDLLTADELSAMGIVARSFCETPGLSGRSIGVIPGEGTGFAGAMIGWITKYTLTQKAPYPNPWIEVPIFTHLAGADPKGAASRNILNIASADVIVILPGSRGDASRIRDRGTAVPAEMDELRTASECVLTQKTRREQSTSSVSFEQ